MGMGWWVGVDRVNLRESVSWILAYALTYALGMSNARFARTEFQRF